MWHHGRMTDALFIAATVGFFLLCAWYAGACETLR